MGGGSGEVVQPPRNSREDPGGQHPKLAAGVARLEVVVLAMVGVEVGAVVVARDGWIDEGGVCKFWATYSSRLVPVLCSTHFLVFTMKKLGAPPGNGGE